MVLLMNTSLFNSTKAFEIPVALRRNLDINFGQVFLNGSIWHV